MKKVIKEKKKIIIYILKIYVKYIINKKNKFMCEFLFPIKYILCVRIYSLVNIFLNYFIIINKMLIFALVR